MNQYIDHTLLKQTATTKDIIALCEEAYKHKFKAVCVPPIFVKLSKLILSPMEVRHKIPHNQMWLQNIYPQELKDCNVRVCTVIGFPFGYSTTESKKAEIIKALEDGADELDIVQCVSAVKEGDLEYINNEMFECLSTIYKHQKKQITVKVILESGILTDEEIIMCCKVYSQYAIRQNEKSLSQLDFIKTSTGYAENGASVHQVQLINKYKHEMQEIKASGGIRDAAFANELIESGATRLGCSAGVKIIQGQTYNASY